MTSKPILVNLLITKTIDNSREMRLKQVGINRGDPKTNKKSYWKIMNRVTNKCKPFSHTTNLSSIVKQKLLLSQIVFSLQCKPLINDSVLPNCTLLTTSKLENIIISSDEIVSLIRNLYKEKANGADDVSAYILILCVDTIAVQIDSVDWTDIFDTHNIEYRTEPVSH